MNKSTQFYKVVCIDENELEFAVLEDTNKSSIEEACDFIKENLQKHTMCRWKIIPMLHTM